MYVVCIGTKNMYLDTMPIEIHTGYIKLLKFGHFIANILNIIPCLPCFEQSVSTPVLVVCMYV